MNRISAFTLIELLVVIAIIAILAAILFPVFLAARAAAYQISANGALNQMGKAMLMYCGDSDDKFMPAFYNDRRGFQTWFARNTADGWDVSSGLLKPYEGRQTIIDHTANMLNYVGDHSGFGYNWGFLGSDFHVTGNYSTFPQCKNPATSSQLKYPSDTIAFATSGYYNAPWFMNGDGKMYDFGFIDPNGFTGGDPNVDYRHMSPRIVNIPQHFISFPGNGLFLFTDGHSRSLKLGDTKDAMFSRDGTAAGKALDGSMLP